MDNQQVIKLALAALAVIAMYMLAKRWGARRAGASSPTPSPRISSYVPFDQTPFDTVPPSTAAKPAVPASNIATDLLPKPSSPQVMDFGEFAPNSLQGQNFLEVAQQLGVDTQGSSMRNANYQIRSDPPNPRTNVGPWLNSTIESDLLRRPLE